MKSSLLALAVVFIVFQTASSPPQAGQRGQTPQAAQPAPLNAAQCKCSIEVTVKLNGTNEPLSDVQVSITLPNTVSSNGLGLEEFLTAQAQARARGGGVNSITVTTDSAGRAMFRDLAEGTYRVQAESDGYFGVASNYFPVQATGSVSVGPSSQAARGVPKQPEQTITLNLMKGATIAGRVMDANGRPARAIQVGAYQMNFQNGHRVLNRMAMRVQTDDRGEYRLFWFPPGEYYIGTDPSARGAVAVRAGPNYPIVSYYPGTLDPKIAKPVVVREGSEMAGIDIALQSANGVTVSGTIVNTIPGGSTGPRGQAIRAVSSIFLVPRDPYFFNEPTLLPNIAGAASAARGNTPNDSVTTFEIRGVPPGTYDFYPLFNGGPQTTPAGGTRPGIYTGRTTVEVGAENVAGIQSVIRPGVDLKIHVSVTGTPPASGQRGVAQQVSLANLRVQLRPKDNLPILLAEVGALPFPDADGVITLSNLVDGQYFISGAAPLPADAYVSEIRMDSRSVFDENVITIGKDSESTLEVVVSRGGGTIQGTVRDTKHNPVAVSSITMVPDFPRRQNALLYKSIAVSSPNGAFSLNGIAPGIYKLFAWEKNPNGAEQNPDFIRDYEALGTSVYVSAGLPLAGIQLTLIPGNR